MDQDCNRHSDRAKKWVLPASQHILRKPDRSSKNLLIVANQCSGYYKNDRENRHPKWLPMVFRCDEGRFLHLADW